MEDTRLITVYLHYHTYIEVGLYVNLDFASIVNVRSHLTQRQVMPEKQGPVNSYNFGLLTLFFTKLKTFTANGEVYLLQFKRGEGSC